jgi:hypothetical protein
MCKMFKDTCLAALKTKDQSPHIHALGIFVCLILKVFVHRLWNDSLNAQAYYQTNGTIIIIWIV